MQVDVIPQFELGSVKRIRIGDYLNRHIVINDVMSFRFAVAYMRVSGLDRIAVSLDTLINKGGRISGSIGVDDEITSYEALEALMQFSSNSTIFHTLSGFTYHPKFYLLRGEKFAMALVGSPNLTRDGLFRNVEVAISIVLNFEDSADYAVYLRFEEVINEFLNSENPNVQPLNTDLLDKLVHAGIIKRESDTREPGTTIKGNSKKSFRDDKTTEILSKLFPMMHVPTAPPGSGLILPRIGRLIRAQERRLITPPKTVGNISTFMMQLSKFDSSHRLGVMGTAEVLIPLDARDFFPQLTLTSRKYPDANFDVTLNTPTGQERHSYRVWFYAGRDEFRLRMNKETIELSASSGGDLIVINQLPEDSEPAYEVTILSKYDPTFPAFLAKCVKLAQGKKWGVVTN